MPRSTCLAAAIALVGILFLALAYGPHLGQGFLKDDFVWVRQAIETAPRPLSVFVNDASGTFYRPVVTLSFAADHALSGLNPFGYGVTNVMLVVGCAAAISSVFLALGLSAPATAIGALAWVMNPHGINMALLWISGRTSLLMVLWSCLSLTAFLHGRRLIGAALFFGALLSKEDAIAVPILVAGAQVTARKPLKQMALDGAFMAPALVVYLWLRAGSGALTSATAPAYYQLSSDLWVIAVNTAAYLDRSATGAAIFALIAAAVYRARPTVDARDRRLLLLACLWFAAGLAITGRIPVRSSLYAVFPSIGGALALGVVFDAIRRRTAIRAADRVLLLVLAALLLLAPIYWARNARWVEPARVSAQLMARLLEEADQLPSTGVIVLEDSSDRFATFGEALGTLATEAVRLRTGRSLEARIVEAGTPLLAGEVRRYRVQRGEVTAP